MLAAYLQGLITTLAGVGLYIFQSSVDMWIENALFVHAFDYIHMVKLTVANSDWWMIAT